LENIMNKKALFPLAIALVLGLVAAFMARGMFAGKPIEAIVVTSAPTTSSVIVAKSTIMPGTLLTVDLLTVGEIAGTVKPEGSFTDLSALLGRVNRVQLLRGQTVMDAFLAPVGTGSGLQALVPEGMRAITIDINEVTGLAGMLTPGCRIDILSTLDNDEKKPGTARAILENIKVQAVGTKTSDAPVELAEGEVRREEHVMPRTVTLLTTPEQAEMIELAGTVGRLRLVLRAPGDEASANSSGVTLTQLKGGTSGAVGESFREALMLHPIETPTTRSTGTKRVVSVIRGTTETSVVVEEPLEQQPARDNPPIMTGMDMEAR